ncbi:MAG TPA: class IV adenylate cyclase [Gemmatimonadaceae bacterium]|nr:class IV adenylate cyclase [Gemmatimonadaceae bacterium]
MREVELKSVVPDYGATVRRLGTAGAAPVFAGRQEDRRYDSRDFALRARDHVLRLRVRRPAGGGATEASVDWKGPTAFDAGYKVREELSSGVADPDALAAILARLGYVATLELDRDIREYRFGGATLRFERYPRMDVLLEVEGDPAAIERAIEATGLPRGGFTTDRLSEFVARYEARTGERAALSDRALRGDADAVPYSPADA